MKRTKILIAVGWLLGPRTRVASGLRKPTDKKVTITCNSPAGDVVTGSVTVTLCSSIDLTQLEPCVGPMNCPTNPIACDSTGATAPISITEPCNVSSKAGGVSAVIACVDNSAENCGSSHVSTLGGKATVLGAAALAATAFQLRSSKTLIESLLSPGGGTFLHARVSFPLHCPKLARASIGIGEATAVEPGNEGCDLAICARHAN